MFRICSLMPVVMLALPIASQAQSATPTVDPALNVPAGHLRIPVLVIDKQGKPVSGLHADDFRVLDNGKPASIAAFLALSSPPPLQPHFTVFYLDDRHLTMEQMKDAKQDIVTALPPALDSNGYVAIVTGTGSENSGFSRDPGQLHKTLDAIHATPFAAEGTRAHNFDLVGTYASLADYASRMSKLPGQRLIVLLSPGFSEDLPEIRTAAATSIERIVQSCVVINAFNTQGPGSVTRSEDNAPLEELSSATGGTLFPGPFPPSTMTQHRTYYTCWTSQLQRFAPTVPPTSLRSQFPVRVFISAPARALLPPDGQNRMTATHHERLVVPTGSLTQTQKDDAPLQFDDSACSPVVSARLRLFLERGGSTSAGRRDPRQDSRTPSPPMLDTLAPVPAALLTLLIAAAPKTTVLCAMRLWHNHRLSAQ